MLVGMSLQFMPFSLILNGLCNLNCLLLAHAVTRLSPLSSWERKTPLAHTHKLFYPPDRRRQTQRKQISGTGSSELTQQHPKE